VGAGDVAAALTEVDVPNSGERAGRVGAGAECFGSVRDAVTESVGLDASGGDVGVRAVPQRPRIPTNRRLRSATEIRKPPADPQPGPVQPIPRSRFMGPLYHV
jgi:hypothetical protein